MTTGQSIWLLDPYQGQTRLHLQHPDFLPGSVAFSSDSRTLAIAWRDPIFGTGAAQPEVWIYHSNEPAAGDSGPQVKTATSAVESSAASASAPP
jgi:hypothetical protein